MCADAASSNKEQGKKVVLARIGKVHGLKGWLRLNSFTSPQDNLLEYQEFLVRQERDERSLLLTEYRQQAGKLLGKFEGFDDPESARSLTGLDLYVRSDTLPALERGEYYWHELQGLTVFNLQQQRYGKIVRLLETGANDVLVVKPDADSVDDRERLIPYLSESVVKSVDLQRGTMTVDWEVDYLA